NIPEFPLFRLFLPKEVLRELKVQSFSLPKSENDRIENLVKLCQVTSPIFSNEIEHNIREITAYIRSEFKSAIGRKNMEYGNISDARILYTAYSEDSILVTANVKDFLIYPLFFPRNEDRLYNIKDNSY